MEQQPPKTGKFALRYGLILAGIGIAFSLMMHFMEMQYQQGMASNLISIVIMIVILCIAIAQFKKENAGMLTLSQALKVGVGAALVSGIITVIYMLIYFNFIETDFLANSAEITKAAMLERNPEMTQEQVDMALEMQQKFFWVTYPTILIFNLFIGFIISLIGGLIMKKTPSEY